MKLTFATWNIKGAGGIDGGSNERLAISRSSSGRARACG